MNMINKNRGFSLIELMVAMALGALLLTGVVQIFLSSKQSYGTIMGISQVQDNGRLAMHFLASSVRKAGYWGNEPNDRVYGADTGITFTGFTGQFDADEYVFGWNDDSTEADVVDGTDRVRLRFSGDPGTPLVNCAGQTVDETQVAIETYYLRVITDTEDTPSLVCETTILDFDADSGGAVSIPAGGAVITTQPLLNGIESMQIQYGIRTNDGFRLQYRDADAVGADDWARVENIRFSMLVASAEESAAVESTAAFSLLNVTVAGAGDSRSRRVFEQSVALRNPPIL